MAQRIKKGDTVVVMRGQRKRKDGRGYKGTQRGKQGNSKRC